MAEYPLTQSSWNRARQDTRSVFHTIRFWVVEMISAPIVALSMYFAIPNSASTASKTIVPIVAFSIWMLAVLGGVFLLSLLVAPYRQRTEARKLLLAKPKPVPLSNRGELIKAIHQVKETAIAYIWSKEGLDQASSGYTIDTIASNEVDEAYTNYQEADKHLEEESLVAGASFKQCISSFQNKVKLHVWIRYYEHEDRPDGTVVLNELHNAEEECIKTIDSLSQ